MSTLLKTLTIGSFITLSPIAFASSTKASPLTIESMLKECAAAKAQYTQKTAPLLNWLVNSPSVPFASGDYVLSYVNMIREWEIYRDSSCENLRSVAGSHVVHNIPMNIDIEVNTPEIKQKALKEAFEMNVKSGQAITSCLEGIQSVIANSR